MAGFVYLASSNLDTFTNARTDDMVITTSCNAQNILIGNQSNSASMITITSNRVGIAKSNPGYALDVVGDINFTSGLFQNGSLFQTSRWSSNALGAFILSNVGVQGVPGSCNQLLVYGAGGIGLSNAGYTYIAASNGFLGVGLSNPAFALDVAGAVNFTTGLFQNGTLFQSSRWTSNATGISILSNVAIGAGPSAARLLVAGTAGSTKFQLNNDITTNRAIVMWESAANEHQFYGMGINNNIFRFQVDATTARYTWFAATSTTTSTELMRLLGTGELGVGTITPGERLHVAGKAYASGQVLADNNTTSNIPAFSFLQDSNTGMYSAGADALGVVTGGVERFRVTDSGFVGIGTATPRTRFTLANPHGNSNTGLCLDASDFSTTYAMHIASFVQASGQVGYMINVQNGAASNTAMVVGFNGNIGMGTSNPSERLHVVGKAYASGQVLANSNTTTAAPAFSFLQDSNTGMYSPANDALGLVTGGTERIRVTDTGLVGIGITNPSARLHVAGNAGQTKIQLSNDVTTNRGLVLGEIAANEHQFFGIGINDSTFRFQIDGTGARYAWFTGTSSTASSELMRLTGTGNLGVGTTTPSERLHVAGNALVSGSVAGSNFIGNGAGLSNLNATHITTGTLGVALGGTGATATTGTGSNVLNATPVLVGATLSGNTSNTGLIIGGTMSNTGLSNPTVAGGSLSNVSLGGPLSGLLTVTVASNIGIGTNNPQRVLDIVHPGNIPFVTRSITNPGIAFNDLTNNRWAAITLKSSSASDASLQFHNQGSNGIIDPSSSAYKFLSPSASVLMSISPIGNVGISVSAPSETLHVAGKIYSTTQILNNSNDSATVPAFSFFEDSNTGMFHPSNDTLGFSTAGTERIRVTDTGNVGIGTATPGQTLHVVGPSMFDVNSSAGVTIRVLNSNTTPSEVYFDKVASGGGQRAAVGVGHVGRDFFIWVNGADRMNVSSAGNVGIATSNPTERLHVVGNALVSGSVSGSNFIGIGAGLSNLNATHITTGTLSVSLGGTGATATTGTGSNVLNVTPLLVGATLSGNTSNTGLIIGGTMSNTGLSNPTVAGGSMSNVSLAGPLTGLLTVTVASNVGIGTTTPAERLNVMGNILLGSNVDSSAIYNIASTGQLQIIADAAATGDNTFVGLHLDAGHSNSGRNNFINIATQGKNAILVGHNQFVGIQPNQTTYGFNAPPPQALSVLGTAYVRDNVGIGTTAPSERLHVAGNTLVTGRLSLSNVLNNRRLELWAGTSDHEFLGFGISNSMLRYQVGGLNDDHAFFRGNGSTASVELMRIKGTGNVGIGTTTPAEALHVAGKIYSTTQVLNNSNDSASVPSFSFLEDSNTGMFHASNDALGFSTAGTERIRVTDTGNVGIGTSTPSSRLDVAGTLRAGATGTATSLLLGDSTDNTTNGRFISALDSTITNSTTRTITFGKSVSMFNQIEMIYEHIGDANSSNRFALGFHSSQVMSLLASGNVGIGVSNTSSRLYVAGTAGQTKFQLSNDLTTNRGIVLWDSQSGPNEHQFRGIGINNNTFRFQVNATTTNYAWFTATSSAASSELMRLMGTGELGVGTTTPAERLHITGKAYVSGQVLADSNTTTAAPAFSFLQDSNTGMYSAGADALGLVTGSVERVRIDSAGNLGIGTTAPGIRLDVQGAIGCHNTAIWDHMYMVHDGAIGYIRAGGAENGLAIQVGSGGSTYGTQTYTEAIRCLPNGSVGVGTTSPTELLHVSGKIYSTTQFLNNSNDSASVPSFSFKEDSNTGMFHASNDALGFSTAGTERIRVTDTGNVGIGTSTPASLLEVGGTFTTCNMTVNGNINLNNALIIRGLEITKNNGTMANTTTTSIRGLSNVSAGMNFTVDSNTSAYRFAFIGNTTEVARLTGDGNLLVGTTAADTAATRLVIEKSDGTTAATGAYLVIKNQNAALATNGLLTTAGGVLFSSYRDVRNPSYTAGITYEALGISGLFTGASMVFRTTDGAAVNFSDGASALPPERARITAAGNFGIGTTTPSERLHVAGKVSANSLIMSGTKSEWLDGAIQLYRTMTGADTSTEFFITRGFTTASRNHIVLHAFNAATCGVQVMSTGEVCRLFVNTNNGNVGIGTSNQTSRFFVSGNAGQTKIQISNDSTTNRGIVLWGDDTSNEHQFYGMGINPNTFRFQIPDTARYAWFNGTSASASTELMRLESSTGRLGIGTTTPAERLHVAGNAQIDGYLNLAGGNAASIVSDVDAGNSSQTYIRFGPNGSGSDMALLRQIGGANEFHMVLDFHDDGSDAGFSIRDVLSAGGTSDTVTTRFTVQRGGNVGIGTSSPSYPLHVAGAGANNISIFAANDIASFSDARVKKDLVRIDDALSKVMSISGYTFTRTDVKPDAPAKRQCGVLAQEVLAVLPEVVGEDPQTGMYNVAYGNVTALLIEAIKEMKMSYDTQIAALNKRVKELEAKISI